MPLLRFLSLGALALLGTAVFKDGPPPAHTGGFGEPTCRQCHADAALNEPGGTLALGSVPGNYEPGRAYDLAVTLRRAGMLRAGFQLAVRFAEGARAGKQAGTLAPTDQHAQVLRDSVTGVLYLEHTGGGTNVTGDSARWVFRWTAPAESGGPVVFHVAANAANGDDSPLGDVVYTSVAQVATEPPAVLVGAGDIAACNYTDDEATALLLDSIPGVVFTAGDNAYPSGTLADFTLCYEKSWGRHKRRTRPSPGNHDRSTSRGAWYYAYFGPAAGDSGVGYYSYDLAGWHILSLNSNIPMAAGSPQEQWLRADLAAHPARCTLAYWHHPRFSSGEHGNSTAVEPLWQALYDAGADVVISGHDHTYERFAPQTPGGTPDSARGIREFVVGTGGGSLYAFPRIRAHSEVRNNTTHGVIKLTLHPTGYDWEFIPVAGKTFRDSGSGTCH